MLLIFLVHHYDFLNFTEQKLYETENVDVSRTSYLHNSVFNIVILVFGNLLFLLRLFFLLVGGSHCVSVKHQLTIRTQTVAR